METPANALGGIHTNGNIWLMHNYTYYSRLLHFQPHELCQVKKVDYVVGPPTLCSITLGEQQHKFSLTDRAI